MDLSYKWKSRTMAASEVNNGKVLDDAADSVLSRHRLYGDWHSHAVAYQQIATRQQNSAPTVDAHWLTQRQQHPA